MKKTLAISGIMLLTLAPLVSSAQEDVNVSAEAGVQIKTRAELERERQEKQENQNTIKAGIEGKREAVQSTVQERRQAMETKVLQRLQKFVDTILQRYGAAIERLGALSARIQSRIDKLEEADIDVSDAQELLDEANGKIAVAAEGVVKIEVKANEVITGDTRALYPELKSLIMEVKDQIKEAHAALVGVIRSLKPGQRMLEAKMETKANATTTATTTAN